MKNVTVPLAVAAAAAAFLARISGDGKFALISEILGIAAVFHFLLHAYFYRRHRFLSDSQSVYSMPKKKIKSIGSRYLIVYLILTAAGMAAVRELYQGTLLAKIKYFFLYILAKVFGFVFENGGIGGTETITGDRYGLMETLGQFGEGSSSGWQRFVGTLQSILVIGGIFLVAFLLIALLIANLRRKIQEMSGRGGSAEIRDTNDRSARLRRANKGPGIFDPSANARVRRLYKKTVLRKKARSQVLLDCWTPTEIERSVRLEEASPDGSRRLHHIYEKARYSRNGCVEDEVEQAKAAARL